MRYHHNPATELSDCLLFQLVEDLPDENAPCELDCKKVQCTEREWINCRWRLRQFGNGIMQNRASD